MGNSSYHDWALGAPSLHPLITDVSPIHLQIQDQMSPVDDISSVTDNQTESFDEDAELAESSMPKPEASPKARAKRRRTTSKINDCRAAAPEKSNPRGRRSGKAPRSLSPKEEEAKREKLLERNRMAANKCRQKKKEWMSHLEIQAKEVATNRAQLLANLATLKDEVLYLKGQLLDHAHCDCTKIREYLHHAAAQLSPTPTLSKVDSLLTIDKEDKEPMNSSDGAEDS